MAPFPPHSGVTVLLDTAPANRHYGGLALETEY